MDQRTGWILFLDVMYFVMFVPLLPRRGLTTALRHPRWQLSWGLPWAGGKRDSNPGLLVYTVRCANGEPSLLLEPPFLLDGHFSGKQTSKSHVCVTLGGVPLSFIPSIKIIQTDSLVLTLCPVEVCPLQFVSQKFAL